MFLYKKTKEVSAQLRLYSRVIISGFNDVFEKSILGCTTEINFIKNLVTELNQFLSNLRLHQLSIACRHQIIHKKPIVKFSNGRCELGDLIVVVKYHHPNITTEAKSIIYQVKLSQWHSPICVIDHTQLNLLSNWPQFSFGRSASGSQQNYQLDPKSFEFGSFLLEPRDPSPKSYIPGRNRNYGICPQAMLIKRLGKTNIDINVLPYSRGDALNFFSHLAFEIGEHHNNSQVKDFVAALYRHVGLKPDPPDEFDGYWIESGEDGFAILEINVKSEIEG